MFDLNERIARWRKEWAQSEALGRSDLEELESHLREEIENLRSLKLSDEEAFWVARHRLGDTSSLAGEFAKINRAAMLRRRISWMVLGILVYFLVTYFAAAVTKAAVFLASAAGLRAYYLAGVALASEILVLITVVLFLYKVFVRNSNLGKLNRFLDGVQGKIALAVGFVLVVAVLVFAPLVFSALTVRLMSVSEYGQFALISTYAGLGRRVLLPVVLVGLLVVLAKSRSQRVVA